MKQSLFHLTLLFCLSISGSKGKILRNNALINKMVSNFHAPQTGVADVMRKMLCKNFPSIPCAVITKDIALKKLIQKTVGLLNDKQQTLQNTSITRKEQTEAPVINSEELSHYLAVENTGYFTDKHNKKEQHMHTPRTGWTDVKKELAHRRPIISGHNKIKKYFPHKVKHKDTNGFKHFKGQLPSSEEVPDTSLKKNEHFSHKYASNLPIWQIDYTKHGDPRLPSYSEEAADQLRGKLVKIGADAEDSELKHRKGVLHPDLYIKNSGKRNVDINYKK